MVVLEGSWTVADRHWAQERAVAAFGQGPVYVERVMGMAMTAGIVGIPTLGFGSDFRFGYALLAYVVCCYGLAQAVSTWLVRRAGGRLGWLPIDQPVRFEMDADTLRIDAQAWRLEAPRATLGVVRAGRGEGLRLGCGPVVPLPGNASADRRQAFLAAIDQPPAG